MSRLIPKTVTDNPWTQFVLVVLFLVSVFLFIYWIRDVMLPFFLAFIVAYMLDPAVDWTEQQLGLSRVPATFLVLTVLAIVLVGLGYYLTLQAVEFTQGFGDLFRDPPNVLEWITPYLPESLQAYLRSLFDSGQSADYLERTLQFFRQHTATVAETLTRGSNLLMLFATRTLGAVGLLVNLVVFFFSVIYFLRDFDWIMSRTAKLVPERYRSDLEDILEEIDELMRAFFRGHLTVCLTIGVLYGTGYLLVGLEGGFLVGFLSGLMNVIPYLGPTIGFLLAFVLGLYQFGLSYWLLGVIAVFVVVQSLEGNILTPQIVGGAVGLHPVVVIFALMLFGKIFGFLGLLFAIPLTAILKVILVRLVEQYQRTDFYRGTSRPSSSSSAEDV